MAYTYAFDDGAPLVRVTVTGRDTPEDMRRRIGEVTSDARWRAGMDVLVDFRGVSEFDFAAAHMPDIHTQHQRLEDVHPPRRIAVVASDDLVYGVSRMFEAMAESQLRVQVMVFREVDEAEAWLAEPEA